MAVTKCLVLVLALCAVALADNREKRTPVVGVYPYAAASAYPYAAAAYPYAAAAYPYAAAAYPYAAAAYPYSAYPYAPAAYAYKIQDDGSYFPGKYGPES